MAIRRIPAPTTWTAKSEAPCLKRHFQGGQATVADGLWQLSTRSVCVAPSLGSCRPVTGRSSSHPLTPLSWSGLQSHTPAWTDSGPPVLQFCVATCSFGRERPGNDSSSTLTIMTITVTTNMPPLARQKSRVFFLRGWEGGIAAGPSLDDSLQCGSAMDCVLRPASNPISVGILPTCRFCTLFLDLP